MTGIAWLQSTYTIRLNIGKGFRTGCGSAALSLCVFSLGLHLSLPSKPRSFIGAASPVNHVQEGENGMAPNHSGTGIPHHGSNLLSPGRSIAVHRAVGTGRFFGSEPAASEANFGVIGHGPTFSAELTVGAVLPLAVNADHRGHGLPLTMQPADGQIISTGWSRGFGANKIAITRVHGFMLT